MDAEKAEDTTELGGNISLAGFKELDYKDLIIIKKIVGSETRRISEQLSDFQRITLTLKPVHKVEDNQKNELHVKIVAEGKVYTAEVTDKNIFFALDAAFKKIHAQIQQKH
ncbi:MAG: hypothetical protein V1659_03990 [Candidatus Woesearchaeota archaeon]